MSSPYRLTTLLALLAATATLTNAQSASIVYPTTAASSATPLPSASGYEYAGCYNETVGFPDAGGIRALGEDGNSTARNDLTAAQCLDYCNDAGTFQYVGLEYGRECYCGSYLSTLSDQLDDDQCDWACNGNGSEICGGRLSLTLYNRTEAAEKGVGSLMGQASQAAWYGTAAVAMFVLAAAL